MQIEIPTVPGPRQAIGAVLWPLFAALGRLRKAMRNRRDAAILAQVGDRGLADIGLTRTDLRDAFAEPMWRDPTALLAQRAGERRTHRADTQAEPAPSDQPQGSAPRPSIRFLV